jgi:hypothetical protein
MDKVDSLFIFSVSEIHFMIILIGEILSDYFSLSEKQDSSIVFLYPASNQSLKYYFDSIFFYCRGGAYFAHIICGDVVHNT